MSVNLVDEIKAAEMQVALSIREAKNEAVRILNDAVSNSENTINKARQAATRDYRAKISKQEKEAEAKAVELVSKGKVSANSFYDSNLGKITDAAKVIAEEVMVRYARS